MAGRPRSFDSEQALDAFIDVFWTKGYDGTSVDDLQQVAGIQRGSFYATFQSKDAVFSAVLTRYAETVTERALSLLDDPATPRAGLAALIRHIGTFLADNPWRGCLLFSSVSAQGGNPAGEPGALRALTGAIWQRITRHVEQLARDAGPGDTDRLAAFVMATLLGLNAMARAGQAPTRITAAADYAATVIETG